MKKFVNFCISFVLFITINYINEDWNAYTKLGKLYYYLFWLIRSCLVWLFCPLFLPEYWFKQSTMFKSFKKIEKDPRFQVELFKTMKRFNF